MLLRPAYLSQNLDRPLPTKDGGTLCTIGEACTYMTGMGKKRELRTHWQRVCKLILAKEDVLTVSSPLFCAESIAECPSMPCGERFDDHRDRPARYACLARRGTRPAVMLPCDPHQSSLLGPRIVMPRAHGLYSSSGHSLRRSS
jgi:hypothetical protein